MALFLGELECICTKFMEDWTGYWRCPLPAASITIKGSSYPDIYNQTRYATNSCKLPIHYSVKAVKWKDRRAWELELVHLKIKMKNQPSEVLRFDSVSMNLPSGTAAIHILGSCGPWPQYMVFPCNRKSVHGQPVEVSHRLNLLTVKRARSIIFNEDDLT